MPKIKSASKKGIVSVFQSADPSTNTIYIEGEGFNKSTLAPLFDSAINMTAGSTRPTNYGGENIYRLTNGDTTVRRAGDTGMTLVLPKMTAVCTQTNASGNDRRNNIDVQHLLSMDPNITSGPIRRMTTNTSSLEVWMNNSFGTTMVWGGTAWYNANTERHLTSPNYSVSVGQDGSTGSDTYQTLWPSVKDPSSDYVSTITKQGNWYYNNTVKPMFGLGRHSYSSFSSYMNTLTLRAYYIVQFIGQSSVDGQPIYLYNDCSTDYTQYVTKHNISVNTTTDLNTFSSVPVAGGTSNGGTRNTASFGVTSKFSSKTFTNPNNGNTVWYTPYFDNAFNYHPHLFTWNKANDSFTRASDITITGNTSSTYMNNVTGSSFNTHAGLSSLIYNETFVSNGNRYLSVFPLNSGYGSNDGNALARTILTYQVNLSDLKQLTLHSTVTVPKSIRQIVFLNDSFTLLGVFATTAFYIYKWNDTSGWTLTATLGNTFTAVGRDSTDRIWAIEGTVDNDYSDIHVISLTVPVRITVTAAQNTYNYTGTTINSNVAVSAYSIDNSRLTCNVTLTISGSTMVFPNNATSVTITTSNTGDVSQNISIIGSGQSEIVASIQI